MALQPNSTGTTVIYTFIHCRMESPCFTTHEYSLCSAEFEQLLTANHCCGTLKRSGVFTVPIKIPIGSLKDPCAHNCEFQLVLLGCV